MEIEDDLIKIWLNFNSNLNYRMNAKSTIEYIRDSLKMKILKKITQKICAEDLRLENPEINTIFFAQLSKNSIFFLNLFKKSQTKVDVCKYIQVLKRLIWQKKNALIY